MKPVVVQMVQKVEDWDKYREMLKERMVSKAEEETGSRAAVFTGIEQWEYVHLKPGTRRGGPVFVSAKPENATHVRITLERQVTR